LTLITNMNNTCDETNTCCTLNHDISIDQRCSMMTALLTVDMMFIVAVDVCCVKCVSFLLNKLKRSGDESSRSLRREESWPSGLSVGLVLLCAMLCSVACCRDANNEQPRDIMPTV